MSKSGQPGAFVPVVPSPAATAGLAGRFSTRVQSFKGNDRGNVGMAFALSLVPIIVVIGTAIDFSRIIHVRNQAQAAVDAAALAAGRAAQLATSDFASVAETAALNYYNAARPKNVVTPTSAIEVTPLNGDTRFEVTAINWVRTPFLSMMKSYGHTSGEAGAPSPCGPGGFMCIKTVATAIADLAQGGNGQSALEISLMLDVTGSMGGGKLDDLKDAAKDLIDIVVYDNQKPGATAKVALAPFATTVNVGSALAPYLRGTPVADASNRSSNPEIIDAYSSTSMPTKTWIRFRRPNSSGWRTASLSPVCVSERVGSDKYTDVGPTTGKMLGRHYNNGPCDMDSSTDPEVNSVQPLSNDKVMLKRRIDKLALAGSTAGQMGTAWAWYLLSPNFVSTIPASVWPADNRPQSYALMEQTDSMGQKRLRKIAVIMTDGDYNTGHCKGVISRDSYVDYRDIDCDMNNGSSKSQAEQLCTAMKAKGITVYAIGFQVSDDAKRMLTGCATSPSHYYNASSGDALKAAFRDIALKATNLRLTH
jgi:uncharacterized protein (UPF0333 family)